MFLGLCSLLEQHLCVPVPTASPAALGFQVVSADSLAASADTYCRDHRQLDRGADPRLSLGSGGIQGSRCFCDALVFLYLSAPAVSCGTQGLHRLTWDLSMRPTGSSVVAGGLQSSRAQYLGVQA